MEAVSNSDLEVPPYKQESLPHDLDFVQQTLGNLNLESDQNTVVRKPQVNKVLSLLGTSKD